MDEKAAEKLFLWTIFLAVLGLILFFGVWAIIIQTEDDNKNIVSAQTDACKYEIITKVRKNITFEAEMEIVTETGIKYVTTDEYSFDVLVVDGVIILKEKKGMGSEVFRDSYFFIEPVQK